MYTGQYLVPVEGRYEEHFPRLQDAVLHPGLAEEGELLQVRTVQVHLVNSKSLKSTARYYKVLEVLQGSRRFTRQGCIFIGKRENSG